MERGQGMRRMRIGWVWMVLAAVLIALGLARLAQRERAPERPPDPEARVAYPAVEDFHAFAAGVWTDNGEADIDTYVSEGLVLLSDAIESVMLRAEADVAAHEMHLNSMRERADLIGGPNDGHDDAADARTAALTAVHLLEGLRAHLTASDATISASLHAAEDILRDHDLSDQRQAVETFFKLASEAVREMDALLTAGG